MAHRLRDTRKAHRPTAGPHLGQRRGPGSAPSGASVVAECLLGRERVTRGAIDHEFTPEAILGASPARCRLLAPRRPAAPSGAWSAAGSPCTRIAPPPSAGPTRAPPDPENRKRHSFSVLSWLGRHCPAGTAAPPATANVRAGEHLPQEALGGTLSPNRDLRVLTPWERLPPA